MRNALTLPLLTIGLAMLMTAIAPAIAEDAMPSAAPATATAEPTCEEILQLPFKERYRVFRTRPECRPDAPPMESMGSNSDGQPQTFYSDARLKADIVPLGTANGFAIYGFHYIGDSTTYVGVMAQDILSRMPDAVVIKADGYMAVNYAKLGLRMVTLAQWQASPASMLE